VRFLVVGESVYIRCIVVFWFFSFSFSFLLDRRVGAVWGWMEGFFLGGGEVGWVMDGEVSRGDLMMWCADEASLC
jgi:hypothetical protein